MGNGSLPASLAEALFELERDAAHFSSVMALTINDNFSNGNYFNYLYR